MDDAPEIFIGLIEEEEIGQRIDKVLAKLLRNGPEQFSGITRSQIEKFIADGKVSFAGKLVQSKSFAPEVSGIVTLDIGDRVLAGKLEGDPKIVLDIVYEDSQLLVVNKPPGLIVHPGRASETGTLAHGLIAYLGEGLSAVGHPLRPGIVHRLDKDTSGLMVVAKTSLSYSALTKQFLPPRNIHRTYLAFTRLPKKGVPFPSTGVIDEPIARDPKNPLRMSVLEKGRDAVTRYKIVEEFRLGLLLELELETGRTHQIRVHLEKIGIPIIGDETYVRGMSDLPPVLRVLAKRQALHAARLSFIHPENLQPLSFEAPLPEDLIALKDALRSDA